MPFTAGFDRVDYHRHEATEGSTRWSESSYPVNALVHAVKDRRRPPNAPIFLDRNGADQRLAWCGVTVKIVLPSEFDERSPDACPKCLAIVREPK